MPKLSHPLSSSQNQQIPRGVQKVRKDQWRPIQKTQSMSCQHFAGGCATPGPQTIPDMAATDRTAFLLQQLNPPNQQTHGSCVVRNIAFEKGAANLSGWSFGWHQGKCFHLDLTIKTEGEHHLVGRA